LAVLSYVTAMSRSPWALWQRSSGLRQRDRAANEPVSFLESKPGISENWVRYGKWALFRGWPGTSFYQCQATSVPKKNYNKKSEGYIGHTKKMADYLQ